MPRKTEASKKLAFNQFAALLQKQMDEDAKEHERKERALVRTTKKDMLATFIYMGMDKKQARELINHYLKRKRTQT